LGQDRSGSVCRDAVVCYLDSTVALPLLTSYAHARHARRPLRRLYDRRAEMMIISLIKEFKKSNGYRTTIREAQK